MKKNIIVMIIMIACALILASCAPAENASTDASVKQVEEKNSENSKAESKEHAGNELKKGETLKIGVVCPISGNSALAGKYIMNGVKILEKELETTGGVVVGDTVYPVEFLYEDNEAKEDITTNVYQKLINQNNVIGIIGPDMSKCILAAGPIAQQYKCPAIGTFTTNEAVTQIGDYIFRACFIDAFQGEVAAKFAWESGYKTASIMYNNADAYSKGLYEAFTHSYKKLGGKILEVQAYSGSDVKDYNVQLTKIKASDSDCVFLPNLIGEVPLQVVQARSVGIEKMLIGGDSWDTPEVAKVAGAENIKGGTYVSAFSAESPSEIAQTFVKAFKEVSNGDVPNSNAVLAYEAGRMIIEGIKNAKTIDRSGVRDAIAQIQNLELPSGIISVGEDRNPIKGAAILQYDDEGVARFVKTINP